MSETHYKKSPQALENARQRRAYRKRHHICSSCTRKVEAGFSKCPDCRAAQRLYAHEHHQTVRHPVHVVAVLSEQEVDELQRDYRLANMVAK